MSRSLPLASMTTQCLHLLCPWLFLFLSFFLNSLSRGLLCYSFPFAVRAQQDVPPHVPPVFLGWAPWLLNRCPGTPGAGPCLPRGCPAAGRVLAAPRLSTHQRLGAPLAPTGRLKMSPDITAWSPAVKPPVVELYRFTHPPSLSLMSVCVTLCN